MSMGSDFVCGWALETGPHERFRLGIVTAP